MTWQIACQTTDAGQMAAVAAPRSNAGSMLGQRRRRWPNIEPTFAVVCTPAALHVRISGRAASAPRKKPHPPSGHLDTIHTPWSGC